MNRRSSTYDNSDESGSDWDSTINESPTRTGPQKISQSVPNKNDENEYAVVQPKSQKKIKAHDVVNNKEVINEKSKNGNAPRGQASSVESNLSSDSIKDLDNAAINSPPPHLSSFRNALSDYSTLYEVMPDIPTKSYESKGKLYTVPESDIFMPPHSREVTNWNDSDAEEKVLKELQQEREKQKKSQAVRDKKLSLPATEKISAENLGYMSSPQAIRSTESALDKRNRTNEAQRTKFTPQITSSEPSSEIVKISGNLKETVPAPQLVQSKMSAPVLIKDATGKSCIFYFEEGSPHFVEVSDDEINAYLPEKVDELEKLFRRVWREVFAAFRIFTSIVTLFIAELLLFIVHHIVRPLLLDTIRTIGDFLFKPLFTLLFNVIIHPIFALLWNTLNALSQALEPLVRLLGAICTQVAIVLRAFRLFVVNNNYPAVSGYRRETDVV